MFTSSVAYPAIFLILLAHTLDSTTAITVFRVKMLMRTLMSSLFCCWFCFVQDKVCLDVRLSIKWMHSCVWPWTFDLHASIWRMLRLQASTILPVYKMLGIKWKTSWMHSKHSVNWATSPGLSKASCLNVYPIDSSKQRCQPVLWCILLILVINTGNQPCDFSSQPMTLHILGKCSFNELHSC